MGKEGIKYTVFQLLLKYFQYLVKASNGRGHGVHSPFVYNFIRKVLMDKTEYPAYTQAEAYRQQLLQDHSTIEVLDLGAGAANGAVKQGKISSIAQSALKSPKYARLLYRFSQYFQHQNSIELGTSLGVTTTYLAQVPGLKKLITMEGSPQIAAFAQKQFRLMDLTAIEVVTGNFDDTLVGVLKTLPQVDFVYIDGNHRKLPTLQYFNLVLENCNPNTCMVFDDIHWSKEMEEAWEFIRADKRVKLTIDVFFLGFVFTNKSFKSKQNFTIRY